MVILPLSRAATGTGPRYGEIHCVFAHTTGTHRMPEPCHTHASAPYRRHCLVRGGCSPPLPTVERRRYRRRAPAPGTPPRSISPTISPCRATSTRLRNASMPTIVVSPTTDAPSAPTTTAASPLRHAPAATCPTTTTPLPAMVNTSAIGNRNSPVALPAAPTAPTAPTAPAACAVPDWAAVSAERASTAPSILTCPVSLGFLNRSNSPISSSLAALPGVCARSRTTRLSADGLPQTPSSTPIPVREQSPPARIMV